MGFLGLVMAIAVIAIGFTFMNASPGHPVNWNNVITAGAVFFGGLFIVVLYVNR